MSAVGLVAVYQAFLASAQGEAATVRATTPFTVTVANAANFLFDAGVIKVAGNVVYSRVQAGQEVAGQSYSVVTSGAGKGVYTFAAGDAGVSVKISYTYTIASVAGGAGTPILVEPGAQPFTSAPVRVMTKAALQQLCPPGWPARPDEAGAPTAQLKTVRTIPAGTVLLEHASVAAALIAAGAAAAA